MDPLLFACSSEHSISVQIVILVPTKVISRRISRVGAFKRRQRCRMTMALSTTQLSLFHGYPALFKHHNLPLVVIRSYWNGWGDQFTWIGRQLLRERRDTRAPGAPFVLTTFLPCFCYSHCSNSYPWLSFIKLIYKGFEWYSSTPNLFFYDKQRARKRRIRKLEKISPSNTLYRPPTLSWRKRTPVQ